MAEFRSSSPSEADSTASADAGFSLLETLAALTILAIGLGALYTSFGTSLRVGDRNNERRVAVQLAQSVLEQQLSSRALVAGVTSGRDAPYQWTVSIEPVDDEPVEGKQTLLAPRVWQLQRVGVTVMWPRERRYQIETLHLTRVP